MKKFGEFLGEAKRPGESLVAGHDRAAHEAIKDPKYHKTSLKYHSSEAMKHYRARHKYLVNPGLGDEAVHSDAMSDYHAKMAKHHEKWAHFHQTQHDKLTG